jgi:hypothetical protein
MGCGPARVRPGLGVPDNRFVGEIAKTYDQPGTGIELSAGMLEVLRSKPEASDITAVEGDMAVTCVEGATSLVYLVFNTKANFTSQDE